MQGDAGVTNLPVFVGIFSAEGDMLWARDGIVDRNKTVRPKRKPWEDTTEEFREKSRNDWMTVIETLKPSYGRRPYASSGDWYDVWRIPMDLCEDLHVLVIARQVPDILMKLTIRETQILNMLVRGMSNRAIANKLGISESTCHSHRQNMARATGLDSHGLLTTAMHSLHWWGCDKKCNPCALQCVLHGNRGMESVS